MGRAELIAALYREGEEQARDLWLKAEADARQAREDGERALEQRRSEEAALQARLVADEQRPVLRAGERKARVIRATAKEELAEKLYRLAGECLERFRKNDERLFFTLAEELPSLQWQQVRVNPADRERAEQRFPGAEIISDPDIFGGMQVIDESGRIAVDNRLQKRLERAWPEILPGLIEAILPKEGRQ